MPFTPDLEARVTAPGAPRLSRPPYEFPGAGWGRLGGCSSRHRMLYGAGARALPGGPPRVRSVCPRALRRLRVRPWHGAEMGPSKFALARDSVVPRCARYKGPTCQSLPPPAAAAYDSPTWSRAQLALVTPCRRDGAARRRVDDKRSGTTVLRALVADETDPHGTRHPVTPDSWGQQAA